MYYVCFKNQYNLRSRTETQLINQNCLKKATETSVYKLDLNSLNCFNQLLYMNAKWEKHSLPNNVEKIN